MLSSIYLVDDLVPSALLTMIEVPLGIIALCGPLIRQQVLRWQTYGFRTLRKMGKSHHRLCENSLTCLSPDLRPGQGRGRSLSALNDISSPTMDHVNDPDDMDSPTRYLSVRKGTLVSSGIGTPAHVDNVA